MFTPELIGILTLIIGTAGEIIYLRSIFKGDTRPHLFTWLIWAILCTIGYLAQLTDDTGPGTWALGITAVFSWFNAGLCLKYGDKEFTRSDKIAFAASLLSIIPWMLTKDPLWSVILISIIDIVGFFPTVRKSWHKPWEENLTAYYFANGKMLLSLFALENLTVVTVLYPATIVAANFGFLLMCHLRRKKGLSAL